jgi:hypothetical protein
MDDVAQSRTERDIVMDDVAQSRTERDIVMDDVAQSRTERDIVRVKVTLPDNDPRFKELRSVIRDSQGRGRGSPAARMLAEWALLGYQMTMGGQK